MSPSSASKAARLVQKGRERLESDADEAIPPLRDALGLLKTVKNAEETTIKIEALVSLGKAYMASRSGTRADNIERAIRCYKSALQDLYKHRLRSKGDDSFLDEPDRVRVLLAIAYDERVLGSREENVQQILVHTDPLDLASKEDAELRAVAQILRGKAFRDRSGAEGLGMMDRHIALTFFEEALKLLRKRQSPGYWAETHLEIGKRYWTSQTT
jgi:hypothetical protein